MQHYSIWRHETFYGITPKTANISDTILATKEGGFVRARNTTVVILHYSTTVVLVCDTILRTLRAASVSAILLPL